MTILLLSYQNNNQNTLNFYLKIIFLGEITQYRFEIYTLTDMSIHHYLLIHKHLKCKNDEETNFRMGDGTLKVSTLLY